MMTLGARLRVRYLARTAYRTLPPDWVPEVAPYDGKEFEVCVIAKVPDDAEFYAGEYVLEDLHSPLRLGSSAVEVVAMIQPGDAGATL